MSEQLSIAIALGMNQIANKENIEFLEAAYEDAGVAIGSSGNNDIIEFFCDYSDFLTGNIVIEDANESKIFIEHAEEAIDEIINEMVSIFEAKDTPKRAGQKIGAFAGRTAYQSVRMAQKAIHGGMKGKIAAITRGKMRMGGALRRGIMKGLGKKKGQQFADWRMARTKKLMKKTGKKMVGHAAKVGESADRLAKEDGKKGIVSKIQKMKAGVKGLYHSAAASQGGVKAALAKEQYADWKRAKAGKKQFNFQKANVPGGKTAGASA